MRTKAQSPTSAAAPPLAANNPFGPDSGATAAAAAAPGGMEDLFGCSCSSHTSSRIWI